MSVYLDHVNNNISASSGNLTINGVVPQTQNANLTSLAALSTVSTGIIKLTNGVASLDTGTYLTSIPVASTSVLGGVKVDGTTITVTDGVITSSGSLPSQTNNNGKLLTTNGSTPSWTGNITPVALFETKVTVAASAIDLSLGNYFTKTISGATTFTVSNVPASGTVGEFILDLTNGGSQTITWWTGVKWVSGTAPTLTAAGRDSLGFYTYDNGTTWTGVVIGKDLK
jgi:hypothetical protein